MTVSEDLTKSFKGKKVLLTGDTGFKGSWLALWLVELGADVTGIGLPPTDSSSLFTVCRIKDRIRHIDLDIRDFRKVSDLISDARPDVVFHLAAQSLVSVGYSDPIQTYETNVMGTLNVLLACSEGQPPPKIVNVTSDKCYRNDGSGRAFTESDALGGQDPYSNSKSCAELVGLSVKASFYNNQDIGSARAGNVIGGGDWCENRLIPDLFRAVFRKEPLQLRNPSFIRPWQFVLEPLYGYLLIGAALLSRHPWAAQAWNFGPNESNMCSAQALVDTFVTFLQDNPPVVYSGEPCAAEAPVLKLDSSKAVTELGWRPILSFEEMVTWTIAGYMALGQGNGLDCIVGQIHHFMQKISR